jgi:SAM-dependent methyltransferase
MTLKDFRKKLMNIAKAKFFDGEVDAAWSAPAYTSEELGKIDRLVTVSGIGTGMSVLEPGCGTGRLTRILSDAVGPSGRVLALDISFEMTQACRERVAAAGNVTVECSALEDHPFGARTFDLIICHQVFPHFDDKSLALKLMRGLLKPYGKLMVFHLKGSGFINDLHRKLDPSVRRDSMPPEMEQRRLFFESGFEIGLFSDDEAGYLLEARSNRGCETGVDGRERR